MRPGHRPSRAHLAALGLTSLLLTVLLLEGIARLAHSPEPVRRVYDPFAYRIPQPGLVDTFTGVEGFPVTVRLNELGMRGPSVSAPVAPGTRTVVFLGGSTTENYGYPLEATFPELCGQRLSPALGLPVRVLNAGMSAATTGTCLGRLQHQVVDLAPDLVVVMLAINDLVGGFHSGYRTDGRHLERPALASTPRSYLLDWLRSRRPGPPGESSGLPSPTLHRTDYSDFPARLAYLRNLRSLGAVASEHGIPVLFLTEGSMYSAATGAEARERFRMPGSLLARGMPAPDQASLAAGMRAFNETVLSLPSRTGRHVFDLAALVPTTWEMYADDCHLTRAGNARVAEALTPKLLELLRNRARPPEDLDQTANSCHRR